MQKRLQGMCRWEKKVLVTVYTIKPTRRKASSNTNHHHHHHDNYHHVLHRPTPHTDGGYNRKAELLLYAQHLRALAHGETTSTSSNNPEKKSNKLVLASGKRKHEGTPTCLGDWKKILLPSFVLRSLASFQEERRKKKKKKRKEGSESRGNKMSTMVKILTAKKQGLVNRLLSAFREQKWASPNSTFS